MSLIKFTAAAQQTLREMITAWPAIKAMLSPSSSIAPMRGSGSARVTNVRGNVTVHVDAPKRQPERGLIPSAAVVKVESIDGVGYGWYRGKARQHRGNVLNASIASNTISSGLYSGMFTGDDAEALLVDCLIANWAENGLSTNILVSDSPSLRDLPPLPAILVDFVHDPDDADIVLPLYHVFAFRVEDCDS